MTWCSWLKSALSAFEPVNYILPIEPEITTHLHVGKRVGIADFGALTRLLVNPGRLTCRRWATWVGVSISSIVGWECSFIVQIECKAMNKLCALNCLGLGIGCGNLYSGFQRSRIKEPLAPLQGASGNP